MKIVKRTVQGWMAASWLALAACGSAPPPPDWQMNARSSIESATEAWLSGVDRIESAAFDRARNEVARTGRPELLARVELMRCATRVASLDFSPCSGFEALVADAAPAEQAYARYLAGASQPGDTALLPKAHQALATPGGSPDTALAGIEDPVSQLVAAGVMFRRGLATPFIVMQAVDTASARGWRRPLLAWLQVQLRHAQAAGAQDEAGRIQRRIEVVLQKGLR